MEENFGVPPPPPPPHVDPTYTDPAQAQTAQTATAGVATKISDKDAWQWAMFCHLSSLLGVVLVVPGLNIIGPVVMWLLKREEHPFIDDQGKEAVNFHISMAIYGLVSAFLVACGGLGIVLLAIVA